MQKDKTESNYNQSIKSTGLFGGVQLITLLISIIRTKLGAILLGASGVGAISIYNSVANLIGSITNLGVGSSAIRNIAANSDKQEELIKTIVIVRRLTLFTSIFGTLLCILLAPLLSRWTFDDSAHTIQFRCLAPIIAFLAIIAGESAIMKGVRQLRKVALTAIAGAVSTLCVSVPIYVFWGFDGIVFSLVLSAFLLALVTCFYSNRVFPFASTPLFQKGISIDFSIVRLGLSLTFSGILVTAMEYVIRAFILRSGNLEMVGLYNAGYSITITYTGMIFTAMGTDFFPRLSAIHKDTKAMNLMINQQIEIAILLILPLLVILITFLPQLVVLLYSSDFLPVVRMVQFAIVSMFVKAICWPISYSMLAKNDSGVFIFSEISSVIIFLSLVLPGYHFYGIAGIGIAFSVAQLLDLIQVFIIAKIKYNYTFSKDVFSVLAQTLPWGIISFGLIFIDRGWCFWIVSVICILLSCFISLHILRKKTQVLEQLKNRLFKK